MRIVTYKYRSPEKLGYTPVLSKRFTSFAGVCRLDEYRSVFWKTLICSIVYTVIIAIPLYFFLAVCFIKGSPISFFYLISLVAGLGHFIICYEMFGRTWYQTLSKRLHALGKSATYSVLIPTVAIYIIDVLLPFVMGNIFFDVMLSGTSLVLCVYQLYLPIACFFKRTTADETPVHPREVLLNRMKNGDIGTGKIRRIKAVPPRRYTPPSSH